MLAFFIQRYNLIVMDLESFTKKLRDQPDTIEFDDTMLLIEQLYDFEPCEFSNGDLTNLAGQNSGSCKLFAFAQLNHFSVEETLACFGSYYRDDVLANPDGDNHQNIRNFIKSGWEGIQFKSKALSAKS